MVMTVTLARGSSAWRTEKLSSSGFRIHDLGAMDTLCVDKTGTLTEARITLEASVDPEGQPAMTLASRVLTALRAGIRSPLDDAILLARTVAIEMAGVGLRKSVRLRTAMPFSAGRPKWRTHGHCKRGARIHLGPLRRLGNRRLAHPFDAIWQQGRQSSGSICPRWVPVSGRRGEVHAPGPADDRHR